MQLSEEQIKALWKQECRPERDNEQLAIAFANAVADPIRTQADARPVAEQWKTWVHEWMGEHDVILPTQAYTELLGTHPEASAPRLSEADRNVIESAIREVELSCQYALAEDLRAILTRASAATVAEPSKIEPMRYDALEKAASEARAHIESECEKIGVGKAAQQQAEPESVIKRQAQKIGELIADRDSWIEAHARLYRLYHDQSPRAGEEIHVNVEGGDVYTLPLQLSGMDKPRFVVHVPCSPQAEPGADERAAFEAAHQHLDLTMGPDAWGRPAYVHSHVEAMWAGWQARAAQSGQRGAPEQILAERKLTCEAIEGAIAFGYQNTNPPPSDDHWLAPFWKIGRKQSELEQSGQRAGVAEDANLLRDAAEKGLDINQQPQLGCVEVWAGKGDDALVFREYYSGHADREAATKCALKRALAAPTQQQEGE